MFESIESDKSDPTWHPDADDWEWVKESNPEESDHFIALARAALAAVPESRGLDDEVPAWELINAVEDWMLVGPPPQEKWDRLDAAVAALRSALEGTGKNEGRKER